MYQAKIEILPDTDSHGIIINDLSTGSEPILERTVYLRDGLGKLHTIKFEGVSPNVRHSGFNRDLAFDVEFTSSVQVPEFGSVYNYRTIYIHKSFSQDFLLSLQGRLYCSNCPPPDSKIITETSSKVINMLEAAQYYADRCDSGKAQKMLNYINELNVLLSNCGCGCS